MNSYGKLCTQYYDIDKPQPQADALAFYLDQAALSGGPLLEPMCGSGRFLLPLMQAGYDITGVDASPEMLAACRRKALRLGLTPDLHQQFLHELDLPCAYALVLIPLRFIWPDHRPFSSARKPAQAFSAHAPRGSGGARMRSDDDTTRSQPRTRGKPRHTAGRRRDQVGVIGYP